MGAEVEKAVVVLHEATIRPPKRRVHAPLICVPADGSLFIQVLSERWECYATHWVAEQNRPAWCPQDADCPHCRKGWAPRVCYYAAIRSLNNDKLYTFALPQSAWDWCPDLAAHQGKSRGRCYRVFRLRSSKQGPVRVELLTDRKGKEGMPSAWRLVESVARQFGLNVAEESE